MRSNQAAIRALLLMLPVTIGTLRADAQGCIVARQCAPLYSADESAYMQPYHWKFDLSLRVLDAARHYNGTVEQVIRQTNHNNVVNRQRLLDLGGSYAASKQLSLSVSVPVLLYGRWSIPLPLTPAGPRYSQIAKGVGDISLSAKYWLLPVSHNPKQNISIGVGVEAPTGNPHETSPFPNLQGKNPGVIRPVDQSIQPGLGAWAFPVEFQAFKSIKKVTFFASGTYLLTPTNINGTPSIVANLFDGVMPAGKEYQRFNSVPDQYLARIGASMGIGPKKLGLTGELAWRVEGVPATDLIGNSDGFRRPGYAMFIEPGITWNHGNESWSINVPVAYLRNRIKDSHGNPGDATFADQFELISYSHRY